MSMHLEGPWLSTTSSKKRKTKITKAQQEEFERGWRDRNQRLKEMHLPKETFEQYLEWIYGKGNKAKTKAKSETKCSPAIEKAQNTSIIDSRKHVQANGQETCKGTDARPNPKAWITGPVSSKPSPSYTGTKIIGIGTMHKSNMVPIFSDDEAKDISKMRR
ncbi:MAG TPA: hypothetical protein VIY47_13460 [Ignavibacteriaceae bacterium]